MRLFPPGPPSLRAQSTLRMPRLHVWRHLSCEQRSSGPSFNKCAQVANHLLELGQTPTLCFGFFGVHPTGLRSSGTFAAVHSAAPIGHGRVLARFASCATEGTTKGVHGVYSHFAKTPPVCSAPMTACPPSVTLTRSMVMRCSPVLRSLFRVSRPF